VINVPWTDSLIYFSRKTINLSSLITKTDAIEEVPSDSKKDKYLIQAGIYALAISRITGRPVKDIILLFLKVPKELTFKASGDLISLAKRATEKAFSEAWFTEATVYRTN